MQRLMARLALWFHRYFIGYGQYRYSRNVPYAPSRPPLRRPLPPVNTARRLPTVMTTPVRRPVVTRRPPSRGVA